MSRRRRCMLRLCDCVMQAAEPDDDPIESDDGEGDAKRYKEAEEEVVSSDDDPAASTTAVAAVPTFPFV